MCHLQHWSSDGLCQLNGAETGAQHAAMRWWHCICSPHGSSVWQLFDKFEWFHLRARVSPRHPDRIYRHFDAFVDASNAFLHNISGNITISIVFSAFMHDKWLFPDGDCIVTQISRNRKSGNGSFRSAVWAYHIVWMELFNTILLTASSKYGSRTRHNNK